MSEYFYQLMKAKIICLICKSKRFEIIYPMAGYKLAKCKSCSMIWDPFVRVDQKTLYNKDYFINDNPKGGYKNYFEGMKINRKTFKERIKKISRLIKKKQDLLDLGCALGDCLLEAKSLGWKKIEGIDPSRYAASFARKRGLSIKCGTLESLKLKKNKYNVVLCQDVAEHLQNPVGSLKLISKILKPNGLLYIITPNVSGNWSKVLKSFWYHYKPEEHISYFSPETISLALKKASFTDIKINSALHIMSVEYILQRLTYYSPFLARIFLNLSKAFNLNNFSFKINTGEMEILAYNKKNEKTTK